MKGVLLLLIYAMGYGSSRLEAADLKDEVRRWCSNPELGSIIWGPPFPYGADSVDALYEEVGKLSPGFFRTALSMMESEEELTIRQKLRGFALVIYFADQQKPPIEYVARAKRVALRLMSARVVENQAMGGGILFFLEKYGEPEDAVMIRQAYKNAGIPVPGFMAQTLDVLEGNAAGAIKRLSIQRRADLKIAMLPHTDTTGPNPTAPKIWMETPTAKALVWSLAGLAVVGGVIFGKRFLFRERQ